MFKLELNADGNQWDVVKGGEVVSTHKTIALAFDTKRELEAASPKRSRSNKVESASRGKQGGWMGNRYSGPRRSSF